MGLTFIVLAAVEVTIAKTKPEALFFAMCVLGVGYGLRAYSHKLSGLKTVTVSRGVAAMVNPRTIRRRSSRAWKKGKKSWSQRVGSHPCSGSRWMKRSCGKRSCASSS